MPSARTRLVALGALVLLVAGCSSTPTDPAALSHVRTELKKAGYTCGKPGSLTLTKAEILDSSRREESSADADSFAAQLAFLRRELPTGVRFRFATCSRSTLFSLLIVGDQKVQAALLVPPDSGRGLTRAQQVFGRLDVPTIRGASSNGFPLADR